MRRFISIVESAGHHDGLVYHGSKTRAITQFEKRQGTRTAFFTPKKVMAQGFYFALTPQDAREYGPYVGSYRIRLNKPLLDGSEPDAARLKDLSYVVEAMFSREDDEWLVFNGIQDDHYLQSDPEARDPNWVHAFLGAEAVHRGRDLIAGRRALDWEVLDHPDCVKRMRERGYDGSLVYEPHLESQLSWFVMDAQNIMFVSDVTDER